MSRGLRILIWILVLANIFEYSLLYIPNPVGAGAKRKIRKTYYKTQKVAPTVRLDVPLHFQEHALSCEVATLKMVLNYRGIDISESQLISEMPNENHVPKGEGTWGNPHYGFVGNIDGSQRSDGYGVYWEPIATMARKYRQAESYNDVSLGQLIDEVKNGNPVIVWGILPGGGNDIPWHTPDGQFILAWSGEHTRVVIGFAGSPEAPTHIITLDPIYGEVQFRTQEFLDNWGYFGQAAVIVR